MSTATISHLPEPTATEPAPMPFLDWAALHIAESLPDDLPVCERHGVVMDAGKCLACRNGTRPVRKAGAR